MQNDQKLKPDHDDNPKRFIDEQTDKRIQEHLTNEDDEISEEDISNIRTDVENHGNDFVDSKNPGTFETEIPDESLDPEHIVKDNTDPEIQTSWNILGS